MSGISGILLQLACNAHGFMTDDELDGVLGKRTLSALVEFNDSMRREFDYVVSVINSVLPVCVPMDEIALVARQIASDSQLEFDVLNGDSFVNLCAFFGTCESWTFNDYLIWDYTPPFVGPFQFNQETAESVGLDMFSGKLQDHIIGLRLLCNANALYLQKRGVPITMNTLYTCHVQGAPSGCKFLLTGHLKYPNQSEKALSIFKKAYGEVIASD